MSKKLDVSKEQKAFECYFGLGSKRSLQAVEKKLGISFDTLYEWSELYAWDEKVARRNEDREKTFEQFYNQKSKDIRNTLVMQITKLLKDMDSSPLGLPFAIRSPSDLRVVAQAYETLVRANKTALMTKASEHEAIKSWSDLAESQPDDDEVFLEEGEEY